MKASMYVTYSTRSLLRGGHHTILAIFCIAVGVMAIVTLQLMGLMINNALTSNVRDLNGGDIAVSGGPLNVPFRQVDLSFFDQLKHDGIITNYTSANMAFGELGRTASTLNRVTVWAVDPHSFPVVTPPMFITPTNGTLSTLLTNNQVVVTQAFLDHYQKKVGDSFDVYTQTLALNPVARTLHVRLAGIIANAGMFTQSGITLLISLADYRAADPHLPTLYHTVYITTLDQVHMDQAIKAIQEQVVRGRFAAADTQTVADLLKMNQAFVEQIRSFLELAGLLALLIGGIGIVNTMQVMLARRTMEIAMLKTTGYRHVDLCLLFGLEAGLLGLLGGGFGTTAATGVSYVARSVMQNLGVNINIPFLLDPLTIGSGVAIGVVTALIFGLMPIVQAANIRPLNVIREQSEGRGISSVLLRLGLLVLFSVLFCVLASIVLNNNVVLGIVSVYGMLLFLTLLGAFFGLMVFAMSVLPIPERFSARYLALMLSGVVFSAFLYLALPAFAGPLLGVSLLGLVVALLPRSWKAFIKMALRNIGRKPARTATMMLALFVGVFAIGTIQVVGQDLREQINTTITKNLTYNLITMLPSNKAKTMQLKLGTIPGLITYSETIISPGTLLTINGKPWQSLIPEGERNLGQSSPGTVRHDVLDFLNGVEGYDVANHQFPDTQVVNILVGRNLNASDTGTNHVLIVNDPALNETLHLSVGSTLTIAGVDGKSTRTLTVVGEYSTPGMNIGTLNPLLTTQETVKALSPTDTQTVFYMKIDPAKLQQAMATIGTIAPDASFVPTPASASDKSNQALTGVVWTLTALASLSLLAGVIIIANAVALAMLERQRELGILKAVGYTRGIVLSEVLIEQGIIGGISASLAMLLVTLATSLLGHFLFNAPFGVNGLVATGLIIGTVLLVMAIASLVAWGGVRVRPLEVLRYE